MGRTRTTRWWRTVCCAGVLVVLAGACSGGHSTATGSSTRTLALPPAGSTAADLQATAVAWAYAFLVGSVADMRALQGPECTAQTGTTVGAPTVALYLQGMRAEMQKHAGLPLDQIKIHRVVVRNVTATTGDALVEYELPASVVGNDNWVMYTIHAGRWKVSDCHAPIGGDSVSARSAPSPTP